MNNYTQKEIELNLLVGQFHRLREFKSYLRDTSERSVYLKADETYRIIINSIYMELICPKCFEPIHKLRSYDLARHTYPLCIFRTCHNKCKFYLRDLILNPIIDINSYIKSI